MRARTLSVRAGVSFALGTTLLLLQPLAAHAGDVDKAKRDLNVVKFAADDHKWGDVADGLKKVQADLDGVSDADKAPVLTKIAEMKAAATQDISDEVGKRIDRATKEVADNNADSAKFDLDRAVSRLKEDDAQALMDPAAMQTLQGKIAALQGGGKKPMAEPTATGAPSAPAPPAAGDSDEVAQVKRDLKAVSLIAPDHNWDALDELVTKAEFDLGKAAPADRPALAASIGEYRQMVEAGRAEERLQTFQAAFSRNTRSGMDGLSRNEFRQAREAIESSKDLLAQAQGRGLLTPDAAKECDAKITSLEQALQAGIIRNGIEQASGAIKQLEDTWADASKSGAGAQDNTSLSVELSRSRSLLSRLPADDPQVQALQGRVDAVVKARGDAGVAADKAAAEAGIARAWQDTKTYFAGWEQETEGPTWKAFSSSATSGMGDLLMPKTVVAIRRCAYFLSDDYTKQTLDKYKDDAAIQSMVNEANKTTATAAAKLHAAFNKMMDEADAAPAPTDTRDLQQADLLIMSATRLFSGTPYKEADTDRARKLRDKWNDAAAELAKKANELNQQLIDEATAKWPSIEASLKTEKGFDPSDPSWRGKTIEFKGVFNRAGWDYDGHFDFALKVNGFPVAGMYTAKIRKLYNETQQRTRRDIDDHKPWDVIAVVEGPGQINVRTTTEVTFSDSSDRFKIESYPPIPCVVIKVIALHAGPVAVGPD